MLLQATVLVAAALLGASVVEARPHAPPPKWKNPMGEPGNPDDWLNRLKGRYRVEGTVEVVLAHPDYERNRCGGLPPDPGQQENPPPPAIPYCEGISGMADCVAVGDGSGVQCILNAKWRDIYDIVYPDAEGALDARTGVFELPGGVSNLSPSMALFGVDPYGDGIRFLLVDAKGLAEGSPGGVRGDRTSFRTPCVNTATLINKMRLESLDNRPLKTCERSIRIDARPGSSVVNISVDIEINDELFTRQEIQLRRVAVPDIDPLP